MLDREQNLTHRRLAREKERLPFGQDACCPAHPSEGFAVMPLSSLVSLCSLENVRYVIYLNTRWFVVVSLSELNSLKIFNF